MTKTASPFAGMALTNQTSLSNPGTDRQLFTAPPAHSTPASSADKPVHLPRKEGSQEPRNVGTRIPSTPPVFATPQPSPTEVRPTFDINDPATEKNSYMFSQDELWALRDVEAEIERTYRVEVSKYNIIRLGLHMLLEDYRNGKRNSFLVRRLRLNEK